MRRAIAFITLLLLLGAATTALVAWFFAAMIHPAFAENRFSGWSSSASAQVNGWNVRAWSGRGKCALLLQPANDVALTSYGDFAPPRWSEIQRQAGPAASSIIEDARGWPFLSLRSTWTGMDREFVHPNERVRGGLVIEPLEKDWVLERSGLLFPHTPDMDYVIMERHRALPLIPIWPGVIGSTIFYVLAWLVVVLLITSPATLRRMWRRRRNRCIRCAYLLRGIMSDRCPECGWSIAQRMGFLTAGRMAVTISLCVFMLLCTSGFGAWLTWRADRPHPLHLAARNNNVATIERLLARGEHVDQRLDGTHFREYESTPLMWAAAHGNIESMRALIEAEADVNANTMWNAPAIIVAIRSGQYNAVRLLIQSGADEWLRSGEGAAALDRAAVQPDARLLRLLIEARRDSAAPRDSASNPLASAAWAGRVENVRLLIEAGFDVASNDDAMIAAIRQGDVDIARLLIDAGADVAGSTEPLLWHAAEHNRTAIARLLLTHGVDPNREHAVAKGWSPLRRAVIRSNGELARLLVEAGANPFAIDDNGATILFQIDWDEAGHDLIEFVFDLGIDVNAQCKRGNTALIKAVYRRKVAGVERLLAAGADPLIANNAGATAMHHAERPISYTLDFMSFSGRAADPEIIQMLQEAVAFRKSTD